MSKMTGRERSAITLIEAAARMGDVCPTNGKLALSLGIGITRASEMLQDLEKRGFLIVQRFASSRQITVVDSGLTTARPQTTTPWRDRDTRVRRQGDDMPIREGARGAPCRQCGCRADACACASFGETRLPSLVGSSIVVAGGQRQDRSTARHG